MPRRSSRSSCFHGSSSQESHWPRRQAGIWGLTGSTTGSGRAGVVWLLHLANAIVIASYLVLFQQSLLLAESTWVQVSPVLKIPTSQGYLAVALGCLLLALAAACSSVRIALTGPETRFTLTYKET